MQNVSFAIQDVVLRTDLCISTMAGHSATSCIDRRQSDIYHCRDASYLVSPETKILTFPQTPKSFSAPRPSAHTLTHPHTHHSHNTHSHCQHNRLYNSLHTKALTYPQLPLSYLPAILSLAYLHSSSFLLQRCSNHKASSCIHCFTHCSIAPAARRLTQFLREFGITAA